MNRTQLLLHIAAGFAMAPILWAILVILMLFA